MDLSNLLSTIGQGTGGADPAKLAAAVQETFASKGGVDGLIGTSGRAASAARLTHGSRLAQNGAVEPQQLEAALGPNNVDQIATKSGSRLRCSCRSSPRPCR